MYPVIPAVRCRLKLSFDPCAPSPSLSAPTAPRRLRGLAVCLGCGSDSSRDNQRFQSIVLAAYSCSVCDRARRCERKKKFNLGDIAAAGFTASTRAAERRWRLNETHIFAWADPPPLPTTAALRPRLAPRGFNDRRGRFGRRRASP
ncbi:unnamed protein product, partial [Iphiclides podalirius]